MASINTIVKRKQYLWLGIVVVGTASAIGGALYLSDVDMSGNGETVAEQEPVPDMTGVVDTTFDDKVRQHATTEMQVTAAQMQKQYEEIRRELDVLNKQRGDDQRRIEKLGQDNAALAEQVKALGANPVTATGEPVPQMPASPPGPEGEPQPGNTPVSFPPQGSVAVPPPTAFYPGNGVTPPPQVTYQSVPVPTCMTMEQANEKAKKLEQSSEAKPVAASLPRLAEGNFRTMPVQTVTATTPSGSRPAVTAHPEQKLLAPRPLFTAAREVKTVVPVSSVTPVTPPRPLRTGEQTAALWIAPYIDNQYVYHQPSSVFFVIKPSAWGKPRIN
ncbi:type IV conjugative transfer system lipoprotein TraV [Escherichia coli]